jgi:hypothetical protein
MAFALGKALMARDISRERKSLRDDQRDLEKKAEEQADQMKKKGMWGSIGRTLGSVAVGAALAPVMGPGALLAAKMAGGYLGGRLGQGSVKASAKDLKYTGEGNFLSSERQDLKDYASDLKSDFKDAQSGMRKGLAVSSIKNPLMSFAAGDIGNLKSLGTKDAWKVGAGTGEMFGKEAIPGFDYGEAGFDPKTATAYQITPDSLWNRLIAQDEFSPFMSKKG